MGTLDKGTGSGSYDGVYALVRDPRWFPVDERLQLLLEEFLLLPGARRLLLLSDRALLRLVPRSVPSRVLREVVRDPRVPYTPSRILPLRQRGVSDVGVAREVPGSGVTNRKQDPGKEGFRTRGRGCGRC